MGTNRYTNLTTSNFNPLTLQEQMMIPLAKQQKHDAMLDQVVKNSTFDVNRLDVDNELVGENITGLKERLADVENELLDKGISSGLSKRLLQLKRDRDSFLSNDGIGGKAQNAYTGYMQNVKAIRANKNISAKDKERYIAFAAKRYNDSGGVGMDENYLSFEGSNSMDLAQRASVFGAQLKPEDKTRILRKHGIIRNTKTLTPEDNYKAIVYSMMTDNKVMDYVNTLSEVTGEDKMNILKDAAKSASIRFKRNDQHDKPLNTGKQSSSKTRKPVTKKQSNSSIYALEGPTRKFKDTFGTYENLEKIIKEGDDAFSQGDQTSEHYQQAKAAQKALIHDYFNGKEGQKYSDKIKSKLPLSLQSDDVISDFYNPLKNEAYSVSKIYENEDGRHALVTDGAGDIVYYELTEKGMEELENYDKMPGGTKLSNLQQMYKRKDWDRFFEKNDSNGKTLGVKGMINADDKHSFAEYFDGYGANSTIFKLNGLSSQERKSITEDTFDNISTGGINNYDFVNVKKANGYEDFDTKNHGVKTTEALKALRQGNVIDKKIIGSGIHSVYGIPFTRISFRAKSTDSTRKESDFYEMTVLSDKINNRGGFKSGESSLFKPYGTYGGRQGKMLQNRMTDAIAFRNIRENYRIDDYDNSREIKKAISPDIFRKNNAISNSDKLNLYKNETGNISLIIGGDNGSNTPLTWDKVIKPENLDDPNYVIPNRLGAAMILNMKIMDPEFEISDVMSEHNGRMMPDPNKMKELARNLQLSNDNVVQARQKAELLRIINSIE